MHKSLSQALSLALHTTPQSLMAGGSSPPIPSGWTPILQAAAALGWTVDAQVPGNYVDGHWVGVDQEILGVDATLYVAGYQIHLPGAIDLPARIVYQYSDSVVDPGTLLQGASLALSDSTGWVLPPVTNPEPPNSEFVGSPFTFQLDCPLTGGSLGSSSGSVAMQCNGLANAGDGKGTVTMRYSIELEIEGVWTLLQNTTYLFLSIFPETAIDNGTDFYVADLPAEFANLNVSFSIEGEHPELPYRITVLEYEENPPVGTPPLFDSQGFIAVGNPGDQDLFPSGSSSYPAEYPATAFAEGVYTGTMDLTVDPVVPPNVPQTLNFSATGPYYENVETAGAKMTYDLLFEVELP